MRALIALAAATVLTLSRYRAEYIWSMLSPLFWVISAWLIVKYAQLSGYYPVADREADLLVYFLIGGVYWNYVEAVWSIALSLRSHMRLGTLEMLWSTPAPRLSFILGWSVGRLLGITLHSLVLFLALAGFSSVHLPLLPLERWLIVVGVGMASILAAYGFAFVLVGLTLRFKDAESLVGMLGNAAPLLGGILFPVTLLPLPLRILSYAFPFTYGVDVLRGLIVRSETLLPLSVEVGLVVGMGVLFLAVGWWVFEVMERKARREGLGVY